jgi:hypothetical protein
LYIKLFTVQDTEVESAIETSEGNINFTDEVPGID